MHVSSDVTTLVALFAIVSPITSIPVFLSLTSTLTPKKRRITAIHTAAVAGLNLLSIQMGAFRIAGAMVIGSIGWSMVMGKQNSIMVANPKGAMVVPLAIPLMAGPGAIATVIAIGNSEHGHVRPADLVIILVLSALTGILLLAAEPVEKLLGEQGLNILTRIFGLLLLAIAVSTVMGSLTTYLHSL